MQEAGAMVCVQCYVVVQLFLWRHYLCDVRVPPDIGYPSRDEILYFRDNDHWRINCSVRGQVLPTKFMWTQNDAVIRQNNDLSFDEDTGHLLIRRFSRRLEARYRCLAKREFGDDESRTQAISVSPAIYLRRCWIQPFPVLQEVRHRTKELQQFTLNCGDSRISTGPVRYRWYHAGTNTRAEDGDRIYSSLLGVLYFDWIEIWDNGKELICSISAVVNGIPYVQWGRVNKLEVDRNTDGPTGAPPYPKYVSFRVVAKRLTDAQLECVFLQYYDSGTDYRHKLTYWSLASGTQIENGTKYYMQHYGRRLTIRNVTEDDEMSYTCMRYNLHGRRSSSVFLDVTSAPVFVQGPPADRTAIQGNDVEINCETRSVSGETPPQPTVWYINGRKLVTTHGLDSSKIQYSLNNSILTAKNVQKDTHIVCFQCEVTNSVDTAFADACLSVILPLVIEIVPPTQQTVAFGDIVNLTVIAIADPSVTLEYRWEFGSNSFDMNSTPPFYVVNPASMEVYINTSLMTEDQLRELEGRHTILVYHQHEKVMVRTDVTVILPGENGTTSNATLPDTSTLPNKQSSSVETTLPGNTEATSKADTTVGTQTYTVSMTMIIAVVNLTAVFCLVLAVTMCVLKERKTEVHAEAELQIQTDIKYDQSPGYSDVTLKKDSVASIESSVDPAQFDLN
ncbi:hypothetical protein BsWGS_14236 [Bradybaena similaris]